MSDSEPKKPRKPRKPRTRPIIPLRRPLMECDAGGRHVWATDNSGTVRCRKCGRPRGK